MTRYIALLRGINVGGHNVKMDRLRDLFSDLGLQNVRSYINSGNIFFDTDDVDRQKLTQKIESHLQQALGYAVPTFLRTTDELESILVQNPFRDIELTDDKRFCVIFTQNTLPTNISLPQHSTKNDMDIVAINPYEAFVVWHIIGGRPPSGKFGQDILPAVNTTRFYHTLAKIVTAAKA